MEMPRRSGIDRLDEIEDVLESAEVMGERTAREILFILKRDKGVYTGDRIVDHVLLMTIGDCDPCGVCRDSIDSAIGGVKHVKALREALDKSRGSLVLRESIDGKGSDRVWLLEYGTVPKEGDMVYLAGVSGRFPKIGETTEYYLSLGMFINTGGSHRRVRYRDAENPHRSSSRKDMEYVLRSGCNYFFGKEADERLGIVADAVKKAGKTR